VSSRRWIPAILGVAGAAFAIHFGWTFPWSRTIDLLADCNWELLTAAGLVNILSLMAKASTWYMLLARATPLRIWTAQTATFVGAAVNSVSISIGGDVVRAQLASERDAVPFGMSAAALMVSRVVEAVALVALVALAWLLFPLGPGWRIPGAVLLLLVTGFVLWWNRAPGKRGGSFAKGWRGELTEFVGQMRGRPASVLGCAMLSWLGQWLTYYWSIRATHVDISPAAALAALLVANLAGILRLTPGNIGVMQGSLIVGMRAFGVRPGDALAGGLALQAIQVLPILAIATTLAGRRGLRRIGQRRSEAL
jgi:uncharacterized membrane protein YbhN (UPF0104 family)